MSSTHMHYRRAPKPPCQPSKLGSSNSIEPPSFLNASGISDRRVGSDESRSPYTSFSNLSSLPGTWHPAVPTVCETLVLACVLDDELLNTSNLPAAQSGTTRRHDPHIHAVHLRAQLRGYFRMGFRRSAGQLDCWLWAPNSCSHATQSHQQLLMPARENVNLGEISNSLPPVRAELEHSAV